ncbi:MAG: hypothetical protein AAF738_11405, partial [Bacteroidota bacterium]
MQYFTRFLCLALCCLSSILAAQSPNCAGVATPINCGAVILGTTSGAANLFTNSNYACINNTLTYSGSEQVYSLNVSSANVVKVQLAGTTGNLDLFIFDNACTPTNCIETKTFGSTAARTLC